MIKREPISSTMRAMLVAVMLLSPTGVAVADAIECPENVYDVFGREWTIVSVQVKPSPSISFFGIKFGGDTTLYAVYETADGTRRTVDCSRIESNV